MLDTALLASIAQQMMSNNTVDVNGKHVLVRLTSGHRLRTVPFAMDGQEYQAIEQNPGNPVARKVHAQHFSGIISEIPAKSWKTLLSQTS